MTPVAAIRLVVISTLAFTAACASDADGPPQVVTVNSSPPGATCEIRQGAEPAKRVTTPAQVNVRRSNAPQGLSCEAPGHLPATREIRAGTNDGMAAAAFLGGGLVGLVAMGASGVLTEYPGTVTLSLQPAAFAGTADRDAFFAAREAELAEAQRAERMTWPRCDSADIACWNARAEAEAGHEAALVRLREARSAAVLR